MTTNILAIMTTHGNAKTTMIFNYIHHFFPITPLGIFAGLLYGAAEDAVRKSSEQPDNSDNHDDPDMNTTNKSRFVFDRKLRLLIFVRILEWVRK